MTMTRRTQVTITAALAAVIISATAFFVGWPSSQDQTEPSRAPVQSAAEPDEPEPSSPATDADTDTRDLPELPGANERPEHLQGSADERREARNRRSRIERIRAALERADQDPGNLKAFFERLNRICAGSDDCDALLDEALSEVDQERAAMIRRIRERLPEYKEQMKRTRMSVKETPPRERYERLHSVREETLGVEEAEAMYGQERAFAQFRFGMGDLMDRADAMSRQQRREALDQLRTESFGKYQEELAEEEGALGRYRHERRLLLKGVEDEQRRQQITRQVRERHLDDETVAQMEERDTQREQQQAAVSDYKQAEQELQAEMEAKRGTLPEEQWQAEYRRRMSELRRQHFDQ